MLFRRRTRPPTDDELEVAREVFAERDRLPNEAQERYDAAMVDLLDRCNWEGSNGFDLTDRMRRVIAARAAMLAIGFEESPFHRVRTIVVHPATMVLDSPRPGFMPGTVTDGPMTVSGHTAAHGPVFIAWNQVANDQRHPERHHDVVLHEFAHQLDFLDGLGDGTPPLDRDRRSRWIQVFQAELDALRSGVGSPLLRPYAATNPSEFFAVATEAFLTNSAALRADRPGLYAVLTDYYGHDPALW